MAKTRNSKSPSSSTRTASRRVAARKATKSTKAVKSTSAKPVRVVKAVGIKAQTKKQKTGRTRNMADDRKRSDTLLPKTPSASTSSTAGSITSGTMGKGANLQRRTALGRGLSVLLSPTAVSIRPERTNAFVEDSAAVLSSARNHEADEITLPAIEPAIEVESSALKIAQTSVPDISHQPFTTPHIDAKHVVDADVLQARSVRAADLLADSIESNDYDARNTSTLANEPILGASSETGSESENLKLISLTDLIPSLTQPRKHFVREELEALARSIAESGLLQPLTVRKNPNNATPPFEIVAGERRYRAAKIAGLREVPVIIRDVDDREALGLSIIENVQRSDLNPVEEAESYQRLITEFGETQEGVAQIIGKDRVTIANALRLLRLAPAIRKMLVAGELSAGHGRALLGIEDPVRQLNIAERAVKEALSVRAVEKIAQESNTRRRKVTSSTPSTSALPRSFSAVEIEDRIRRTLGTKVTLSLHSADTGEVRISFFSKAELENLLERIGA